MLAALSLAAAAAAQAEEIGECRFDRDTLAFAGTPLEGRAFWPRHGGWVQAIERISDDETLVTVLVKVTAAQIAAQREAAEARYDEEFAEAEAERFRQVSDIAAVDDAELADALEDLDSGDCESDELAD